MLTKSIAKKVSSFRSIWKWVFWNPCFTTDCRDTYITVLASTTGPFFSPPYTPFTNYPHLLLTPIYYLPPFIIYPHLLFTPIYYLPPFTIYPHLLFTIIYYLPPLLYYPFYYFSGIKTHRKSFRRFIFSSKHSHLMSKMTGIRNSYVEIFKKFA